MRPEEDLHVLDSLLRGFPRTEDAFVLDAAIDWYNHGGSARSAFIGFLCYYIALESVALAVADDTADLGLVYARGSRTDRERKRLECIRDKHDAVYLKDPVGFVRESYFDCVVGLKEKTRRVAELVFGSGHSYLAALFEERDGYSLSDIRGRLAHGAVTPLDSEEDKLVRERLPEIAEISKEFLTRVIFLLKPTDPLPTWSQLHSSSLSMADPRATMYVTKESILPTTDWRIRPEWCD